MRLFALVLAFSWARGAAALPPPPPSSQGPDGLPVMPGSQPQGQQLRRAPPPLRPHPQTLAESAAATMAARGNAGGPDNRNARLDKGSDQPGGEKAEEEGEAPKPINWTDLGNKEQPPFVAALVNFAILAFLYIYYGRKPIAAALKARRDRVAKQIEEAQKMKLEAEARSKQYATKLEALGQELATTRAILAEAGVSEKARIVRDAEEKAARMEKDALFMLEQERRQTHQDLQREAVRAALAKAEDLLRTRLTQADQERVAEEFLATLVPAPSKAAPAAESRARAAGESGTGS